MKAFSLLAIGLLLGSIVLNRCAWAEGHEVLPAQRSEIRAHLWVGDGPAEVISSGSTLGNRFRLGAEVQFGPDYRFILGWTVLDIYSTGETSPLVGAISRSGSDLNVGFFLIPDRMWLMYSLYLGSVQGSQIFRSVNNYGNGLSMGYRIYEADRVSIALELEYQHLNSENTATFNFTNQTTGFTSYPSANVYSLNLRVGVDIGGM